MHGTAFRVLALLSFCAGGALEDSASGRIEAFAGEAVVLPCRINGSDEVIPTVEWSKKGPEPIIAFLYRDGCETHEMKNQVFWYRTNLFMNELNNGNISLRISNVQPSDAGRYMCTVRSKTSQEVATWELVVVAGSEPKLSVVPAVDGSVTLQCTAHCWFPEPEIAFLDFENNHISAEDPKTDQVSVGCLTVTRRLTLQTHSERVTCRVQHPKISHVKVTEIHIPAECMKSCVVPAIITAAVSIFVCGIIAFLCKTFVNCAGGLKLPLSRQSSDRSTTSGGADSLPQISQADNFKNATAEHQRITNELTSKLREKEEIIRRLTKELNDLRSKQSPVVHQNGRPTMDSSPSKSSPDVSKPPTLPPQHVLHNNMPKPEASTSSSHPKAATLPHRKDPKPAVPRQSPPPHPLIQGSSYNHSSPALLTLSSPPPSSPSAGAPPQSTVTRSLSLSESRPRPNGAQRPRRHTTSIHVNNRFTVLGDLPEDSEPLLR